MRAQMYGFIINIWVINPITPRVAKPANALLCPTEPISLGAHQQPIKKPKKCDEPSKPICEFENSNFKPDNTSSGPRPELLNCNNITERNNAMKEIIRRMNRSILDMVST